MVHVCIPPISRMYYITLPTSVILNFTSMQVDRPNRSLRRLRLCIRRNSHRPHLRRTNRHNPTPPRPRTVLPPLQTPLRGRLHLRPRLRRNLKLLRHQTPPHSVMVVDPFQPFRNNHHQRCMSYWSGGERHANDIVERVVRDLA